MDECRTVATPRVLGCVPLPATSGQENVNDPDVNVVFTLDKYLNKYAYENFTMAKRILRKLALDYDHLNTKLIKGRYKPKRVDLKYRKIRDYHQCDVFDVRYCPTTDMSADIFTKPSGPKLFNQSRLQLNVMSLSLVNKNGNISDRALLKAKESEGERMATRSRTVEMTVSAFNVFNAVNFD
ncbi:hypothetical protein PHMEG_00026470, partial [Phytophthora megakarya]